MSGEVWPWKQLEGPTLGEEWSETPSQTHSENHEGEELTDEKKCAEEEVTKKHEDDGQKKAVKNEYDEHKCHEKDGDEANKHDEESVSEKKVEQEGCDMGDVPEGCSKKKVEKQEQEQVIDENSGSEPSEKIELEQQREVAEAERQLQQVAESRVEPWRRLERRRRWLAMSCKGVRVMGGEFKQEEVAGELNPCGSSWREVAEELNPCGSSRLEEWRRGHRPAELGRWLLAGGWVAVLAIVRKVGKEKELPDVAP